MSQSTVGLTVKNKMHVNKKGAPTFDLVVVQGTPDFTDDGVVSVDPEDVPGQTDDVTNNGGIYVSGSLGSGVEGIVAWLLPDDKNNVVIYFHYHTSEAGDIRVGVVPKGTELNDALIKQISQCGKYYQGSLVIGRGNYPFQIDVSGAPNDNTFNGIATFTLT